MISDPNGLIIHIRGYSACSFGRIWLISHGLSANEQYFSLTPNQPTVLSAMTYKPNQPKRTGRFGSIFIFILMYYGYKYLKCDI